MAEEELVVRKSGRVALEVKRSGTKEWVEVRRGQGVKKDLSPTQVLANRRKIG